MSKDLEKAIEIVNEYFNFPIDDVDATNFDDMPDCVPKSFVKDVAKALAEAHSAGRQSALDEVVPVLEFTTHAAEYLFGKVYPQPNMCPTFYHTLTYEGDVELVDKCKRARELLQKLKEMK